MKDAKHTPGPWVNDGIQISRPSDYRPRFPIMRLAEGSLADVSRAVACVNGCDAAGVADPGELDVLLAAAWAVNENRTMIPHNPDCVGLRGKADCDSLGCRGGSGYVPKAILISLGDALRRVRGES